MVIDRPLFSLTHVASQLIRRWLPYPMILGDAPGLAFAPQDPDYWLGLLRICRAIEPCPLPWLSSYLLRDADGRDLASAASRHWQAAEQAGASIVTPVDEAFPLLLEHIADPPAALTVLGNPAWLAGPAVAIVGSRRASAHALRHSYQAGYLLAEKGWVVVSGGALGCDIAAHRGCLVSWRRPLPAVAVLACGLAQIYPRTNAIWLEQLVDAGACLVSERLWHAPCFRYDFAARNRLVTGLARLTIVMQAAQRSGALLTARLALDQGRELGILTHPAGDVRAAGGHTLIGQGGYGFATAVELATSLGAPKIAYRNPVQGGLSSEV